MTDISAEEQERIDFEAAIGDKPQPVVEEPKEPEAEQEPEPEEEIKEEPEKEPEEEPAEEEPAQNEAEEEPAEEEPSAEEQLVSRVLKELTPRLRNIDGKIGGLNSTVQKLSAADKAARQGAPTPTDRQITEAFKSGAKMDALKDDYPEFFEALQESMNQVVKSVPKVDVAALESKFEKQLLETTRRSGMIARQLARLDMAHPSWEQDVETDQYKDWLYLNASKEIHGKTIQALSESDSANDALKVLDAYYEASNPDLPAPEDQVSRQRKTRRLADAEQPTSGRAPVKKQPETEQEAFERALNS